MGLKDGFGGDPGVEKGVQAVQHLLEPGETVRAFALGAGYVPGVRGNSRMAVVVTDAHICLVRIASARLKGKELLQRYPLAGSRVWRKGTKLHVNDSTLRLGLIQFGMADRLVETIHGHAAEQGAAQG